MIRRPYKYILKPVPQIVDGDRVIGEEHRVNPVELFTVEQIAAWIAKFETELPTIEWPDDPPPPKPNRAQRRAGKPKSM